MTSNFVDYVKILVRSGKGGAGSAHLLRVKYNAKAGPDGGDGGRGGHVILRGTTQRWTLLHLKYTKHVFAEDGEHGGENLCTGRTGWTGKTCPWWSMAFRTRSASSAARRSTRAGRSTTPR